MEKRVFRTGYAFPAPGVGQLKDGSTLMIDLYIVGVATIDQDGEVDDITAFVAVDNGNLLPHHFQELRMYEMSKDFEDAIIDEAKAPVNAEALDLAHAVIAYHMNDFKVKKITTYEPE